MAIVHSSSPPVHQHRTWRHLQRAAVAATPSLSALTQSGFCSLMVPAASIAVWILQHEPRLASCAELHITLVNAIEFEALDHGRWFQFIPWLLGRPAMQVRVTLQGDAVLGTLTATIPDPSDDEIERHLRTRGWTAVGDLRPAEIFPGTLQELSEQVDQGERRSPDLCVMFAPSFAQKAQVLLTDAAILPLLHRRVPLALFSTSETEQLTDVFVLESHGLVPRDRECWPNPWALPADPAHVNERRAVYGKLGWEAKFDALPEALTPDPEALNDLSAALDYVGAGLFEPDELDRSEAILILGESLRTAPRDSAADGDDQGALLRLPRGVAVDTANGAVYQLQDATALLLEAVPQLPAAVLETVPEADDLLRRVMWAVRTHREHVAPFVDDVDNALRSQFAKLDA